MTERLPSRPQLEYYRKQAKSLLKAHRSGDVRAAARIKRHLPRLAEPSETEILASSIRLSDAQLVIAREHGFASWPRLKRAVKAGAAAGAAKTDGGAASSFCFVPGLGIRAANGPGLIAPGPVSVTRDGATLTVTHLLSSGGETVVRVEIDGIPAARLDPEARRGMQPLPVTMSLNDGHGTVHRPHPSMLTGTMQTVSPPPSGPRPRIKTEWTLPALAAEARNVQITMEGPPPVDTWQVSVPIVPIAAAGLSIARSTTSATTLCGVTLRIMAVAADRERTVLQVAGSAAPTDPAVPAPVAIRFVRDLGRDLAGVHGERRRVLVDDRGREYVEEASVPRTIPYGAGLYIEEPVFPPLPSEVRSAELIVPVVTVEEANGEATLEVPLRRAQPDRRMPLDVTLPFGSYPVHVVGAEFVEQHGRIWLSLEMDYGGWHEGRKLARPGQVEVNAHGSQFQFRPDLLRVPLDGEGRDAVRITLKYPTVAIAGPWRLPFEIVTE
ncbi:MAG: hypothetical protein HY332_23350 [Chloroflexi bacterium]|nr:hypothetical protein [Chloroflexota bacterium]